MVDNKQKIETLEQIITEYELKLEILKQELRYLKLNEENNKSLPATWVTTDTKEY
jgi:uncharacterized coiled-coil protein SlyX